MQGTPRRPRASIGPCKGSGVQVENQIGWLTRYRKRSLAWGSAYQSHAEALEAAGLSE